MSFFSWPFAKRKADLDEEIRTHLQMDIQDRKDRGESSEHPQSGDARVRQYHPHRRRDQ